MNQVTRDVLNRHLMYLQNDLARIENHRASYQDSLLECELKALKAAIAELEADLKEETNGE